MIPEQLGKIAELLDGQLVPSDAARVYVRGVNVDTRKLAPGELFFALTSERDGHNFLMDAYTKGAIAAVVQRKTDIAIPQIIVRDTLYALGELAKSYRNALAPKVIAITGSVGKTTAREMITTAMKIKYNAQGAKYNYNNLIGLPLTILDLKQDTEFAIVELGINCRGEMERLVQIAQPNVAVITAIAEVHTEGLGNIDGIIREKLKIAEKLNSDEPLFINADSEPLLKAVESLNRKVITYGIEHDADFCAENLLINRGKPEFIVRDARFMLTAIGKASVYGALAAVAVADFFKIPIHLVAKALESPALQPHRMQLLTAGDVIILDDSYNSSPIALAEALKTAVSIDAKRTTVILGDMLELGRMAEKYHRQVAEMLIECDVSSAMLFGKLMKHAFQEAKRRRFAGKLLWSDEYEYLVDKLNEFVKPGDLVLIKGSRAMRMERFVNAVKDMFGEDER